MDKKTGKPLLSNGAEITSSVTFRAEKDGPVLATEGEALSESQTETIELVSGDMVFDRPEGTPKIDLTIRTTFGQIGVRGTKFFTGKSRGNFAVFVEHGLVEVKMGGEALVEEGAKVLNELAALIDTKRMKKPSFKMVVTAVGDCAYAREDGVLVCPIGSLKP